MATWIENNVYIYSNDGATLLYEIIYPEPGTVRMVITDWGVRFVNYGTYSSPNTEQIEYMGDYIYAGGKVFKGLSATRGATTAEYAVGNTYDTGWNGEDEIPPILYLVEEKPEANATTFNLASLKLSEGTHEITVKAKANGYTDSPTSNTVNYVIEPPIVTVTSVSISLDIYGDFNEDILLASNVKYWQGTPPNGEIVIRDRNENTGFNNVQVTGDVYTSRTAKYACDFQVLGSGTIKC